MAEVRMLTEQDILNANTYVPIGEKSIYARGIANLCVTELTVSVQDGEKEKPMPSMSREEPKMKMLYGMWVMLRFYLKFIDTEELTEGEYDEWGKISLFNQLERFKSSKNLDVKNRAYDIVNDYREFYRMIGCEINSLLVARNDMFNRAIQFIDHKITPELVEGMAKELGSLKEQIDTYKESKE